MVTSGAGALLLDLADESANVLARVAREFNDLALPHTALYGVRHGNGERGASVVGALLGGVLGAHCLPQCSDGLIGGGHACMFAHECGHTEAGPLMQHPIGHMNVASWMCGRDP